MCSQLSNQLKNHPHATLHAVNACMYSITQLTIYAPIQAPSIRHPSGNPSIHHPPIRSSINQLTHHSLTLSLSEVIMEPPTLHIHTAYPPTVRVAAVARVGGALTA